MQQPQWIRLETLFHDALALPLRQRAELVQRVSLNDEVLAVELQQLLYADEKNDAEDFLRGVVQQATERVSADHNLTPHDRMRH